MKQNRIKLMKYRIIITKDEEYPIKLRFRFLREEDGWKWIQIVDYFKDTVRAQNSIDSWRKNGWEVFMDNDTEDEEA